MALARYIDADDLAEYISVSRSSIARLVKDGALPPPIELTEKIKRWDREAVDAKLAGTPQSPVRSLSDVAKGIADGIAKRHVPAKKKAGRR